ncbi:MAG: hypothetical protein RL477_530 [Pseudomonadota bacterium]|jgi:uncharacterized protein (DUF952 family)
MTHPRTVFHLALACDWLAARACGVYDGSDLCRRDGFIHMSTREQLPGTLARYFQGRDDVVLLAADTGSIADRLRWDDVPGKGVYPHYYGRLRVGQLRELGPVRLGADGVHVIPQMEALP